MTLLIVAPDWVAAQVIARQYGLLDGSGALPDGVSVAVRPEHLASWPRGTAVVFFDMAIWPERGRAAALKSDLLAAVAGGRLRLACPDDIASIRSAA